MDFVQPLYEIAKDICRPIGRRLCYAISLPKKFTELQKRLTDLCQVRDDIKDKIDRVKLEKAPTRECSSWIADVGKIEEEVKNIEEQHLVSKRCLKGCFPDVIARVRLGEDVEEMIERVKELQEKSKFEAGFVTDLPLAKVEIMPVPSNLIVEGSVGRTLQKILDHIRDEQIQKIGIWGKGGVGKTTLMGLLNNKPEITPVFEVVIWATVSKSCSIRKVQDEVAERLSLKIKNDSNERFSDEGVRNILSRELEGKKYLLLLDDVWEFMNLADVGIPSANQNNGCKVVLTTREREVCRKMLTDVEISVETLSEEEAWKMFESVVGGIAKSQTIQLIAQEIVQKCGGLPLALNVVGAAVRKVEDVSVWRNLLRKLKSPDLSCVKDMSNIVFTALKTSYDHLDSHDTNCKNHFLYCGLYPEDHEIKKSQLIRYWRAEGLLSSGCTLAEASDEGRALLHDLIDASLLEKCEDDNHVKMHDVIRDFVLNLTSPEGGEKSRHVVRAGLSSQEIVVDGKEWEEANRISFMLSNGYSLPEMPNCPNLSTLLLQSRWDSSRLCTIPESFFNHMPSLRVLDLSYSGIRSLPSSVSKLDSLRALLLKGCSNLGVLPREINALKRLEVLCVTEHKFRDVPTEIWELTSLKCLKLKGGIISETKVVIPSGKISKLSQLEQFAISGDDLKMDEESKRVVAEELSSLTRLSSLEFDFGSVNNLKQFVGNSKAWRDQILTKFKFSIGDNVGHHVKYKCGLQYVIERDQGDEGSSIVSSAVVRDVIKRSELLQLQGCKYLETLADEDGLQEDAFAKLEYLYLESLSNLRSIFCCEISAMRKNMQLKDNFKSLQELTVGECPMLKQLFSSWGLLSQLLNLQVLEIYGCEGLEELVSVDDHGVDEINSSSLEYWTPLPKLMHLTLRDLKEFGSSFFSKRNVSLRWPSLENLCIEKCPKLKRFAFGAHDDLPRLKGLQLESLSEFVGFGNGDVPCSCCWPSLERLDLVDCPKLETFALGPHNLPKLKVLELQYLPELVSFGEKRNNDNIASFTMVTATATLLDQHQHQQHLNKSLPSFPCLSTLIIRNCPNLASMTILQPCLEELELRGVSKKVVEEELMMSRVSPTPLTISTTATTETVAISSSLNSLLPLSNLKSLSLTSIKDVDDMQFLQGLGNLTHLSIESIPELVESLPVGLRHLTTLRTLSIWWCENLMALPEWIGNIASLERLVIYSCPKLTSLPDGMRQLTALQDLIISECGHVLYDRCQKETGGEDWPKIAHIPNVDISRTPW